MCQCLVNISVDVFSSLYLYFVQRVLSPGEVSSTVFRWRVNTAQVQADTRPLLVAGDRLVSSFLYSPRERDTELECATSSSSSNNNNNNNNSSSMEAVARVEFSVEARRPALVRLQRAETQPRHSVVWIPFTASSRRSWRAQRQRPHSGEAEQLHHRSIYDVMGAPLRSGGAKVRRMALGAEQVTEVARPVSLALTSPGTRAQLSLAAVVAVFSLSSYCL